MDIYIGLCISCNSSHSRTIDIYRIFQQIIISVWLYCIPINVFRCTIVLLIQREKIFMLRIRCFCFSISFPVICDYFLCCRDTIFCNSRHSILFLLRNNDSLFVHSDILIRCLCLSATSC